MDGFRRRASLEARFVRLIAKVTDKAKNIPVGLAGNFKYSMLAAYREEVRLRPREDDRNMNSGPRKRTPPLTLVKGTQGTGDVPHETGDDVREGRELNWSILMAHAQAGDPGAYRRLLAEISPYLRSLAARRLRDPADIEDTVQDILLTIHAIRYTYDPTRPFGPWLVAIAQRRIIDRLRKRGRQQSRESPLTEEHETLPAEQTNIVDEMSDRRELHEAVECPVSRHLQCRD